MNDKDIVQLFFERSQQAVTELSQKYGKLCFHIALNILKCNEDAEECENDTYLKTWNSVPPDEPICLRAYVSRIVRNLALSQYRYNHRQMRDSHLQVYLSELQDCIPASQDVEASADDTVNSAIQAFLSTLDLTTKALFIDIMVSELPKGLYIRADEGTAWDCEVKEVYFVDNGLGGVFVINASYIVDATEGVGVRFHSMIETFSVLQSSDSVQILTSEEAGITTGAVK